MLGNSVRTIVRRAGCAGVLLGSMLWASSGHAYPMYDDGTGVGCVECHNQFAGGTGVLHQRHRIDFAIGQCNLCHPTGGGTTPVRTYTSGTGGGLGCAGCHGLDYGETSPNSGQPKATAYGLRLFHVMQGVTVCGTTCHVPGALGHPDPSPPVLGENVPPPYYGQSTSNLTDPCSSSQEDLPSDADSVGLDNDGDGAADSADSDCTTTTTTTTTSTTTTTLPPICGAAPVGGCIASGKGVLLLNDKTAGREKLKLALRKLQATVAQNQFGDPVAGSTSYTVCVYDGANQLKGEYVVARAGDSCDGTPCWSPISDQGYRYKDRSLTSDGVLRIVMRGGDAGKGTVKVVGKNDASTLPTGIAAALQGESSATVQVVTSDASCFAVGLTVVKKADGSIFSAVGP
jgi:hypothetical protein